MGNPGGPVRRQDCYFPATKDQPIKDADAPLWINPDTLESAPTGATPSQLQGLGFKRITTTQRSSIDAMNNVDSILSQMEKLMSPIFPQSEDDVAWASGAFKRKIGSLMQKGEAPQFEAFIDGTLAPMIRALGEKGALANEDVTRAKKLLPKLSDRADLAWSKLKQLQDLFSKAKRGVLGTGTKKPTLNSISGKVRKPDESIDDYLKRTGGK
jgi:hypothetical protein